MGSHAKPRTRVRTVALGTLAVGATLTAVGLTAAAFDPVGGDLADGAQGGTEPVDFTASGLGAPVPVAAVNPLDGASPGVNAQSAGNVPAVGAVAQGPVTQGSLAQGSATQGGVARAGSSRATGKPRSAATEPTWPRRGNTRGVPEHQTPQGSTTDAQSSDGSGNASSNPAAPSSDRSYSAATLADSFPMTGTLPFGAPVAGLLGEVARLI